MADYPVVQCGDDGTPQLVSDHPDPLVVAFCLGTSGAEDALHNHPQERPTFVERGRFRFALGEATRDVGRGARGIIPGGLTPGCVCLEPGLSVDSFTPRRDDGL